MASSKLDYLSKVRESCKRAEQLLEDLTEVNVRYAALELRMCIEGIIYNDVQSYPDGSLPEGALTKWQPNKIVSHILSVDLNYMDNAALILAPKGELIDVDGKLNKEALSSFGTEFPEGWGKFRQANFAKKITHKLYHSLGNILHVPTIGQMQKGIDQEKRIKTCSETLAAVKERLGATLGNVALWQSLAHVCVSCNTKNMFHFVQTLKGNERLFRCINPECSAEYQATQTEENTYNVDPYGRVNQCSACDEWYVIWRDDFVPGKRVLCTYCNEPHMVGIGTVSVKAMSEQSSKNAAPTAK